MGAVILVRRPGAWYAIGEDGYLWTYDPATRTWRNGGFPVLTTRAEQKLIRDERQRLTLLKLTRC